MDHQTIYVGGQGLRYGLDGSMACYVVHGTRRGQWRPRLARPVRGGGRQEQASGAGGILRSSSTKGSSCMFLRLQSGQVQVRNETPQYDMALAHGAGICNHELG